MARPQTFTVTGDTKISNFQSRFGGTSIAFDGTGDKLTVASTSDFAFGTGDFTAECFIRRATTTTNAIFDFRSASVSGNPILLFTSNTLQYSIGGAVRISVTVSGTLNTWRHVAVVRYNGTTKLYVDGTAVGTPWTTNNNIATSTLTIGSYYNNTAYFVGYIDEVRVSNVARYTGNFTAPTVAFTDDADTVLLVHADGAHNSTTFTDDDSYNPYDQTNSDLLYIEDGYFTPDGYYVYTALAQASLSHNATLSASVGNIKQIQASLSSEASFNCIISHIEGADLQAFTDAQLTTTAERIRATDVSITSELTQTIDISKVLSADANVQSTVTFVTQGDLYTNRTLSFSSEFAQTASAERLRDDSATINSEFTVLGLPDILTPTGEIKEFAATLTDAFAQSQTVVLFKDMGADFYMDAVCDPDGVERIRVFDSTQSVEFAQTAVSERIIQGACAFDALFSPSISAEGIKNTFAVLDSTTALAGVATANRSADIALSSIVDLSLQGDRTRDYASTMSFTAEIACDIVRVKSLEATVTATASTTVLGRRLAGLVSSITAQSAVSCTPKEIQGIQLTLFNTASITCVATENIKPSAVQTPGFFSTLDYTFTSQYTGPASPPIGTTYIEHERSGPTIWFNLNDNQIYDSVSGSGGQGPLYVSMTKADNSGSSYFVVSISSMNFNSSLNRFESRIDDYGYLLTDPVRFTTYTWRIVANAQANTISLYRNGVLQTANYHSVAGFDQLDTVWNIPIHPYNTAFAPWSDLTGATTNVQYGFYTQEIGVATLNTNFNVSAEALNVQQFSSAITANFSEQSQARRLRTTPVAITAQSTVSSVNRKLVSAQSTLAAVSTSNIVVKKFAGITDTLQAVSSLSATGLRYQQFSANLATESTIFVDEQYYSGTGVDLYAEVLIDANLGLIKRTSVELSAFNTQLAGAVKIGQGLIQCDIVSQQTTTAVKTAQGHADDIVVMTQVTDAVKTARTSVNVQAQLQTSIDVGRTKEFTATMSALTSQADIDIERIRSTGLAAAMQFQQIATDYDFTKATALLTANTALTPAATSTKPFDVTISAEFTQQLGVNTRVRFNSMTVNMSTVMEPNPYSVFRPQLTFESIAVQLTVGQVIAFDPVLQLMIPAESNMILVPEESLLLTVPEETRVNMVRTIT